jgi:trehalose 6-phosphate phosphatase
MTFLLSESGLTRLEQIIRPGVMFVFDFDGTLAPIVTQHEKAFLPSDILRQLLELSKYAPVAIITGRSVEDIRARLRFTPQFIVGNHGLEGVPGWEGRTEKYKVMCQEWAEKIQSFLKDRNTFDPGIALENKRYSLSVHYRMVRDHEKTEKQLIEAFEELAPRPRIITGKYVFNLVPEGAADKGSALEQLMRVTGTPSAIYVGDDVTDEDVFRLKRKDVLSVRIEYDPNSSAEFFLNNRLEISQLLDEMVRKARNLRAA